jgi:GxxExxY protein
MRNDILHADVTEAIIKAFYEVYNDLGFGFRERFHRDALTIELREKGHHVDLETKATVWYKQRHDLGTQRIDMIVDGCVVVEVKSSLTLPPSSGQQLHNYLRATNIEVGLLLHFGEEPRFYRKIARAQPPKKEIR